MSISGVFICPSCQSVVRSEKSPEEGLTCETCQHEFGKVGGGADSSKPGSVLLKPRLAPKGMPKGNNTGSGIVRNMTAKRSPVVNAALGTAVPIQAKGFESASPPLPGDVSNGDEEIILPDGSRRVKRRKKKPKKANKRTMVMFLTGWFFVITVVFFLFKSGNEQKESTGGGDDTPVDITTTRDRIFLRENLPEISNLFQGFVLRSSSDGREQFIDRSAEFALPFSRFYRTHSFNIPEVPLRIIDSKVLEVSSDPLVLAIETIWEDAKKRKLGSVYFHDGERWKLDWECFAPYSTESWSRFRSDLGEDEGLFRLLVRKRRSSDESKRIYLSFYRAPEFVDEDKEFVKTESSEVALLIDSPMGQEFLSLWNAFEKGETPYDSISPSIDPEGFMRITVSLGWETPVDGTGIGRDLVLKEIIGPGWFGSSIREASQSGSDDKNSEGDDANNAGVEK